MSDLEKISRQENREKKQNEMAEKCNDNRFQIEKGKEKVDVVSHIESILEQKEYHHWNTPEEEKRNQIKVNNYEQKKRIADKSSLYTQRSILIEFGDRFDKENIERIGSEIGSNKLEIYNEDSFKDKFGNDPEGYIRTGLREMKEGKICVRDTDDLDRLSHTATHETMHDLSCQKKEHSTISGKNEFGHQIEFSIDNKYSGIHKFEVREVQRDGKLERKEGKEYNRYLNEGFTEYFTIQEMKKRDEEVSFDSYTQEVGWTQNIIDAVGEDTVADAYFGGDIKQIQEKVDSMSDINYAWETLNYHIDSYHVCNNTERKMEHKKIVDEIIDSLQSDKDYIRTRRL